MVFIVCVGLLLHTRMNCFLSGLVLIYKSNFEQNNIVQKFCKRPLKSSF